MELSARTVQVLSTKPVCSGAVRRVHGTVPDLTMAATVEDSPQPSLMEDLQCEPVVPADDESPSESNTESLSEVAPEVLQVPGDADPEGIVQDHLIMLGLSRAWKAFLLLPRTLLHRPLRGGLISKSSLIE